MAPVCLRHHSGPMTRNHNLFLGLAAALLWCGAETAAKATAGGYEAPASPRVTYNFNPGWTFIKKDVADSETPGLDDSNWADVSTPHTYNEEDSFDQIITRSG